MPVFLRRLCGLLLLAALGSCRPASGPPGKQAAHASLQDVRFFSNALHRTVLYRIYLPAASRHHAVPGVYLLHGAGAHFADWSSASNIQPLASAGYALVMPEGNNSYFLNAASVSKDRYEDFLIQDLIPDVETRFPVQPLRAQRAVIGVSMGGFGALTIALHHPSLFAFVGALSPPLDAPHRPFAWKRFAQSLRLRRVFGPRGSAQRNERDPSVLLGSADRTTLPFLFLSCGRQEPLLPANVRFAHALQAHQVSFHFDIPEGGHSWQQWNTELPEVMQSLQQHVPVPSDTP